jgi:hypothetical protein
MMTPGLPYELLKLRRDLRADFSETRKGVGDVEPRSLLEKIDPTPDSVRGSSQKLVPESWPSLTAA